MEISDLHVPFMKWLKEQGVPFTRARSDRESTMNEGEPDFALHRNNRTLFIEFKFEKGRIKPSQIRRHDELRAGGNDVHVVRTMEHAILLTSDWLATIGEAQDRRETATAIDNTGLRRFGTSVYEPNGTGGWNKVRTATAADANLPSI